MIALNDLIDYIQDRTDVSVSLYESKVNGPYIELEYYSPLGEDVVDDIWLKETTVEAMIDALDVTNDSYKERCEEQLELYVKERPRGTENFSVRQLLEDAEWKVAFFKSFYADVVKAVEIAEYFER